MTAPLKFPQLLAGCTPGEWAADSSIRGGWVIVKDASNYPVAQMDGALDARLANAQLIARCNPDTMKQVYEALDVAYNYALSCGNSVMADSAKSALARLDGLTGEVLP